MSRFLKVTSLIMLSLAFMGVHLAFAATSPGTKTSYPNSVFIVAIIIGGIIALILVVVGKQTSQEKGYKEGVPKPAQGSSPSEFYREVTTLYSSKEPPEEKIKKISAFIDNKVAEKSASIKQELNRQYEKILTEKDVAQQALRKKHEQTVLEKKQTEGVIRSVAEGVMVINNKGEVLLMNPAAEKLLGIKKEDKIGKPLLENIKEEQLFSLAKETPNSQEKEIELTSKDAATKKILRSSTAVIEDEYGKTVGMVSVLSDITKQKELDQMKSDFVAKVSHELRNPMGAIKQSLSVILSKTAGPLTEHQERFLSNAQRNLERLGVLIDDLLDLAKLEAHKTRLNLETVSIEKVINEVCETLDAWARNKSIRIEKKLPADLPQINLDPNRIIQVLTNIIANAIKFTLPNGAIIVEVKLLDKDKLLEVSVADTGPGIDKKDIERIFDKFQQAGEKTTTAVSGTGLGLSIAREIVKLHNGKIWAESGKGQGAKFIFTLPLTTIPNPYAW